MGHKFVVQAVAREGYDGAFRAGRKWPAGTGTEIEVVETKEVKDAEGKVVQEAGRDPDEKPTDGRIVVGTKTLDRLRADPNLRVVPAGDIMALARASTDVVHLRSEVERLTLENQRLQDELTKRHGGDDRGGAKKKNAEG